LLIPMIPMIPSPPDPPRTWFMQCLCGEWNQIGWDSWIPRPAKGLY
jgi:hypothetical protein